LSSFQLEHDWMSFDGNETPEILATYSQLRIVIDGQVVTQVEDRRARMTRDYIVGPLYPIAEWIVSQWWPLLEESESPSRGTSSSAFSSRHKLRMGREGYAFPDLMIVPEGASAHLVWRQLSSVHESVRYLASGEARVPMSDVRQSLTDLVAAVDARLEHCGLKETFLQTEWRRIQESVADQGEHEFCLAAAWLGLDPYDVDPNLESDLCRMWKELPESLREDVCRASEPEHLRETSAWVMEGVRRLNGGGNGPSQCADIRNRLPNVPSPGRPWDSGYQFARIVRDLLGFRDEARAPLEEVAGELPLIDAAPPPERSLDAVFVGTAQVDLGVMLPRPGRIRNGSSLHAGCSSISTNPLRLQLCFQK